MVQWFDGTHLARSPAQWDAAKLNWVNAHVIKHTPDVELAGLVAVQLAARGAPAAADERLARMCALFKDRCATLVELADCLRMYFVDVSPREEDVQQHVTETVRPALQALRERLAEIDWDKGTIAMAIKETLAAHGLKMPQLAHALRVLVCGRVQTPSIDAVLELFQREVVLRRLQCV